MNTPSARRQNKTRATVCTASLQLWHERLGHVHHSGIRRMVSQNVVDGLKISGPKSRNETCKGYFMGKTARTAIPRTSNSRAKGILDLVHTDIAGPLPVLSKGCVLYYVTFIDGMSQWASVYPLQAKSECFSVFKKLQLLAERMTGRKIKAIRFDGGASTSQTSTLTIWSLTGSTNSSPYHTRRTKMASRSARTVP